MVTLTQRIRRHWSGAETMEASKGFATLVLICLLVLPEQVFIYLIIAVFNLLFYPLLLMGSVLVCAILSRVLTKHWRVRKKRTKPYRILLGDSCIDEENNSQSITDYNHNVDNDRDKLDDEIECEICLLNVKHNNHDDPCIILEDCDHQVCGNCLFLYLSSLFGDLNKYPLKCFAHKCDHELNDNLVAWLLDWKERLQQSEDQSSSSSEMEEKYNHNDRTSITKLRRDWIKFNKLSKIPIGARLMCPNSSANHGRGCDAVMSLDSDYYRIIPSEETPSRIVSEAKLEYLAHQSSCSQTVCGQCGIKFGSSQGWLSSLIGKWKYPCPICCKYFCDDCLSIYQTDVPELGYFSQSSLDFNSSTDNNDGSIRMCRNCFTLLYRRTCEECKHPLCTRCHQTWHSDGMCKIDSEMDKNSNNMRMQWWKERRRTQLSNLMSEEMMFEQGWVKCPGCETYVCKDGGCNHMSHKGCPQTTSKLRNVVGGYYDRSTTHFCYCCGELLHQYHEESDHTVHFTQGLFSDCRKAESVRQQRRRHKNRKSSRNDHNCSIM